MSVASATGLVVFIVMNIASCQMPKVKCNNFIEYMISVVLVLFILTKIVSCQLP